jgi:DNA-binding MarR family transcriptional regulator
MLTMDQQALRTLRILEELEREGAPSQRYLSRKLKMSLGLVNSFVKRLAQKGYCKVTSIPKNRVQYLLTPKGAAEKSKLTYEYLLISYKFYRNSQEKIRRLFQNLEKLEVKNVVFWGAGELAEITMALIPETSLQLIGVVDCEKVGQKFCGLTISDPKTVTEMDFDMIICTKSPENIKNIISELDSVDKNLICYPL